MAEVDAPEPGDDQVTEPLDAAEPESRPNASGGRTWAVLLTAGAVVWGGVWMLRMAPADEIPSAALDDRELPDVREGAASPPPKTASATPPEAKPEPAAAKPEPAAAEPELEPEPAPADDVAELARGLKPDGLEREWAKFAEPEKVHYQVRRGGTLRRIANLYKIFHHEIAALNPGIDLDKELKPGTKVVVFDGSASGEKSESIGFPGRGSLRGAVPMVRGPGRELKHIPWKGWGTAHTVAVLDRILRTWAERHPDAQPILVGNMSAREGGRLKPHSTHQSGRDVDISYPQLLPKGEVLNWREMSERNLDSKMTWALLRILRESGEVEVAFADRSIQEILYRYALDKRLMSKAALRSWLEYPHPVGSTRALVQHVKGHRDHFHVRIKCPDDQPRCESR